MTLLGLCLPAAELAWRWLSHGLGPRPVTVATHVSGDWAVVFLLLSLALTPARAIFGWNALLQVRRRVGVAAAAYALAHLAIYALDQKWDLTVVLREILARFYLTIGFFVLLALLALALTSTDGWQRRLKRSWKRLHFLAYPATAVAILHFFLQSKLNAGEAILTCGLFAWLMFWRAMPSGPRTRVSGLLLLACAATMVAFVVELAWYGIVHNIDMMRIAAANFDAMLVPRPVHKVAAAGFAVVVLHVCQRLFMAIAPIVGKPRHRPG